MTADFRSDTLTRPTPAMRSAMAAAEVGDDVYGEDPTVRALEVTAAELLGQAAALFVPSGTMANQVAVRVHCRPGDELICEERAHVYCSEGGSVAGLSGTQVRPVAWPGGFPAVEQLAGLVRATDDAHNPRSRLLALENTHAMAGGTALTPGELAALAGAAHRLGLLVHVDGARLVNAAVASGCPVAELGGAVDSVTLCLSKGLGAPVGSVVAGSRSFIEDAWRARKAFGGGMRQAGVLAAAGLLALRDGPAWVAADHRRAQRLADGLAAVPGWVVTPPQSNIVMVAPHGDDRLELLAFLEARGVRALASGANQLRFVTHHDLGDGDVEQCIAAAAAWRESHPPGRCR